MNLPDTLVPIEGILTPPHRSVVARVLTALLLMFAVVLVSTAIQLHRNIGEVRAAESDNKVWNIVQFEVDYRDLRIAVLAMSDSAVRKGGMVPPERIRALQLEFDIFYSRINALFATLTTGNLRPLFQVEIDQLNQARDEWAARFDALAPSPALPDTMAALTQDVAALEPLVRRLSVDVLQVVVARAEAARLQEGKLLATMFGASIALIGLTILSVILSVRLGRSHAAAETSLGRSTALAKAAFESSVTAMLICDDKGRILLTNPAASVVFGHTDNELQGYNLQDRVIPPERMAEYRRFLRFMRQSGDGGGGDATIGPVQVAAQRATGEVFPAAVLVRITRLDAAQRLILVFVQDISDQVEYEQRLQAAADEARRYATAQGRFLATMSHELRTPLHGVRAALDLLARKKLSQEAEALVGIAQQSCTHALQQTDSALHAIRATHENETDVPFDPVRIAQDLTNEMQLIGKADGTTVRFSVSGAHLAETVVGRPRAFTRALGNLVANATKYARGGTVKVKLTLSAAGTLAPVMLRVDVIDDGPGIPADKIDRIFEPFNHDLLAEQKADGAGFGLGLSIVKQAVEVMQGDITVISDCGQGCHVTITLALERGSLSAPPALAAPEAETQPMHRAAPGAVALVVDDAEVNCALMGRMLAEMGYRVETAYTGCAAVKMAETTAYDLILMDFYMPKMTGIEAARHIREKGASRAARIIGITARVDLIGSEEGNPPEMNGVLFKPFGITELEGFLAAEAPEAPAAGEQAPATAETMAALRGTLEMCGPLLGLELLRDTLSLAHKALEELDRDPALCVDIAHRAAGAAMMAGLHDLGRALRDLEHAGRAQTPPDGFAPLTARLAATVSRAERLVAELELEMESQVVDAVT